MAGKKARGEMTRLSDDSHDHRYFVITPRIVWAFCRTPYDYALWAVIKDIASEWGECKLQTSDLATLAMMSDGQVQDSREYLMAVGLLRGRLYREPHYHNPVWHLTVPDLWVQNVEWSTQFLKINARLLFKAQQKAAVKKLWNRYKLIKTDRKARQQWHYDEETVPDATAILTNLGLFDLYEKTDSPGESDSGLKTDSPDERARQPGESPRQPGGRARQPGGRARQPGERKKNHKKNGWIDEWMNDPICKFLHDLPGYNPANLDNDRTIIVEQHYSLEALEYLWEDVKAEGDNPIGLLLYRCGQGLHSPRFLDLLAERNDHAARNEQPVARLPADALSAHSDDQPLPPSALPIPDETLTQRKAQIWQAALGEMRLQVSKATYDVWIAPAQLVSVDGTWRIALPHLDQRDWWATKLQSTIRRILTGLTGQPCEPEFITYADVARPALSSVATATVAPQSTEVSSH